MALSPDAATNGSPARELLDIADLNEEQLERRQRIVQAAFELGADGGYDAVQMRDVAATANVALATIYRYFSSKDHLLAAAMTEWTSRLQSRVTQSPPKGKTPADQLVDVLQRACRGLQRQPKLGIALVRALQSSDVGVREGGAEVQRLLATMAGPILADFDEQRRADILATLGHVWYSALAGWANGRHEFDWVMSELERAVRVLVDAP